MQEGAKWQLDTENIQAGWHQRSRFTLHPGLGAQDGSQLSRVQGWGITLISDNKTKQFLFQMFLVVPS